MKLTAKQEKFVQELIKGKTQREAYKIAYPTSKKWKDNIVDVKASELLKNGKVKVRYDELHGKVLKRAEEKAIITAEEVLRGIASIAKDDIKNYLSFKTIKKVVEYDEDGEPVIDYGIAVEIKDSDDIDTSNISEISIDSKGTFKFKRYCKDKALYKLADIMGLDEMAQKKQKLAEDRFKHEKDIDGRKYW